MGDDEVVEQPRLPQVVLDRVAERLRAVGPEGEPELERPERARVLERDVDHVAGGALVRDVRLLVRERVEEVLAAAHEQDAAGLRQVEPLVGVERHRVDPVEAGEEVAGGRCGRGGEPVGAVDVQPDAGLGAHVGERVDRVDGAGQRRARRGDDRDRDAPGGAVGADRLRDRLGHEAPVPVDRQRAHVARSRSRGSRPPARSSSAPRRSSRASPSTPPIPWRREPGIARSRAAASAVMLETVPPLVKAPAAAGKADELGDPADGLVLDLGGGGRPDGEVRVEARGEQIADDADLEARRGDEREVARARLGDRLVEAAACVLEHLERTGRPTRAAPPRAAP